MRKTCYTLWWKDPREEDAHLMNDESIYYTKGNAFKRARYLSTRPEYDGCLILVRRVTIGKDTCTEWSFECNNYEGGIIE